jgi:DnaJ-domain-containing protein 1
MAVNNDMSGWRRQNSDPLLVEATLTDGTSYRGSIMVPRGKDLRDVINGIEQFVELETQNDGTLTIAKSAIKMVRPGKIPNADQLEKKLATINSADSFGVLGLPQTANLDDVRAAYVTLAHLYHPDRFLLAELPTEVMAYLNIMIRRINSANTEVRELLEFEGKQQATAA